MSRDRKNSLTWVLTCGTLTIALMACSGPVLLVRQGALPTFETEVPIWRGATLVLRSTSARSCQIASTCPRQINLQPALSVWLIWQVRQRGNIDVLGQRLLYLPVHD